ncbi:hypothetical protein F2Q69_00028317 [Brassica cretica]|uniref:Uncharacterized protein n=1 Tax=Brassica cretica TaxID=69181 RepID=A0A8S9RYQ0_BRACR|nr:hypothetical protein F2Q69_00028317 [Brassica cretica]
MRATSVRRSGQVALGFQRDEYGERLHGVAPARYHTVQISEPTTEAFRANVAEGWALVHGKKQGKGLVEDEELVVSPSQFRPLQDIDEEKEEDNIDEYGKETEEGEILESKEEEKKRQQMQASLRGKKLAAGSAHKPSRSKCGKSVQGYINPKMLSSPIFHPYELPSSAERELDIGGSGERRVEDRRRVTWLTHRLSRGLNPVRILSEAVVGKESYQRTVGFF